MNPSFSPLELLAYTMYQVDQKNKGEAFVRWWCMRDDLREKYMEEAFKTHQQWSIVEKETMEKADNIS